ncbi:MAG: ABC transporter ATP-binding protein [Acidobacteriota bacterium]
MTDTPTILDLDRLGVRYGRTTVLRDVSLRIDPGEVVALIGRNGVGKSSIVRCLLGHQRPSSGSVRLFGDDVWRHRSRLMTRVGVVPEEPDAPPAMTARQLAAFCKPLYPTFDRAAFDARLDRFGVPTATPFGKLSKGQKAQIHLALALAPQPDFLVLDDPTLGLDVVARRAVFEELVDELADLQTTVFLTSHDLPGVESLASRVAVLSNGGLVLDEAVDELKERHRHVELPIDDDSAADALIDAMSPLAERHRGRRREVLVERFDPASYDRLVSRFGAERVATYAADLEEILIATTDVGAGPERDSTR